MFEGEMASLEAIQKTNIVRVPQPIKIIDLPGGGAMFVMEYLKMKHLNKYVCTSLSFYYVLGHIFLYLTVSWKTSCEETLFSQSWSLYLSISVSLCVYVYILKIYISIYVCVYTAFPYFALP